MSDKWMQVGPDDDFVRLRILSLQKVCSCVFEFLCLCVRLCVCACVCVCVQWCTAAHSNSESDKFVDRILHDTLIF